MRCKKDNSFSIDGYTNFVFLSKKTGRPIYHASVRRILHRITSMNEKRDIQLPDLSPHILRHTYCTRLAEAGLEPKAIQHLMGHNDIRTTMQVYNHINADREKAALDKLDTLQQTYIKQL